MADQSNHLPTTLAVLAGGRGSRMGRPKDRLKIGGKPVLDYLLDRFDWNGPTILVTAPGADAMEGCGRFTLVVADPVEGEGPLRGVLTALAACTSEVLVITTIDMPGWDRELLEWLLHVMEARPDLQGAVVRHDEQIEPFPLVVRGSASATVSSLFDRGVRSAMSLSDEVSFVVAVAPADWPAITWTNLNRPEDVASFEQRLASLGANG